MGSVGQKEGSKRQVNNERGSGAGVCHSLSIWPEGYLLQWEITGKSFRLFWGAG